MRKVWVWLAFAVLLFAPAVEAAQWTITPSSCGSSPSATVQQRQFGNFWLLIGTVTVGSGTVTTCTLNFQTDGGASPTVGVTQSCLAEDTSAGAALGMLFSGTVVGNWGYGEITLTSAANMAGHNVTLWCFE